MWWKRKSKLLMLSDCCLRRTPASIMIPELGSYCQATFQNMSDDSVTLGLFTSAQSFFRVDSVCCATFSHEFRPHVFLSSVLGYSADRNSTLPQLDLAIPTDVFAADRRMACRFPVYRESGLSVIAEAKHDRSPVTAINLSVQGMLIEFPEHCDPGLAVGDPIVLSMRLRQHAMSIAGTVRHCRDRQYGLSFPSVMSGKTVSPPPTLRAIVKALESAWLRSDSRYVDSPAGNAMPAACGAEAADPAFATA